MCQAADGLSKETCITFHRPTNPWSRLHILKVVFQDCNKNAGALFFRCIERKINQFSPSHLLVHWQISPPEDSMCLALRCRSVSTFPHCPAGLSAAEHSSSKQKSFWHFQEKNVRHQAFSHTWHLTVGVSQPKFEFLMKECMECSNQVCKWWAHNRPCFDVHNPDSRKLT